MHKREWYIPKTDHQTMSKADGIVYLYDCGGSPAAMAFHGKAQKPDFHTYYRSTDERFKAAIAFLDGREKSIAFKAERKETEKKARRKAAKSLAVGSVWRYSWGYEQTQVEFFELVGVKGQTATLRPIKCRSLAATGPMSDKVYPMPGQYCGEPFQKRVQSYSDKGVPYFSMPHGCLSLTNPDEGSHHSWYH